MDRGKDRERTDRMGNSYTHDIPEFPSRKHLFFDSVYDKEINNIKKYARQALFKFLLHMQILL